MVKNALFCMHFLYCNVCVFCDEPSVICDKAKGIMLELGVYLYVSL